MSVSIQLFRGTARILAAEILAVPSGLVALGVVTRILAPADFGLFALTLATVSWLEWSLTAILNRATVRSVGESQNWRTTAESVLHLYLVSSLVLAGALIICSKFVAGILAEPRLSGSLKLFALDLPFWTVAQGCRAIFIATGDYRKRFWVSIIRSLGRIGFAIPLILWFRSVEGAILGWLLSSLLEFVVARIWISVPWKGMWSPESISKLLSYVAPLSIFGLILRFYDKTDLFFVKMLGPTENAGIYGAAQNLAFGLGLITIAISTPLLGTLTRLTIREARMEASRVIASTFRLLLLLTPFIALGSAASPEIVTLLFGMQFAATGPILRILLFSAFFMVLLSIHASIMIAFGKTRLPLLVCLPMLPVAISGYILFIPVYGMIGAASVSMIVSGFTAIVATIVVHTICPISLLRRTWIRSLLISIAIWVTSGFWHATGPLVVLKLIILSASITAIFFVTGEFNQKDYQSIQRFLNRKNRLQEVY